MAKKGKEIETIKDFDETKYDQHLREQAVCDMIESNYMPYAMSVIISRALADVRDGLKPSQRKVLYTMKTMGLRPGNKSKSANIAGATLRYNPHSDQSCYETMVRMVDHNETLLAPYVNGKGSFGKHYSRDMACASSRYTEACLSKLGMELFNGIDKNAIDMIDNYDGTLKEPSVLPVAFPTILANPTLGIAVGFACNICSFNLKELCEATIQHIKYPKDDLLSIMPAPDFTTGGQILYNKEDMIQIYKEGKGSIKIRSKYIIDKKKNRIEIKEIPYSTTAEAIVERVIELCKSGKIKEINDIRDDTDKKGLTITIEYKRSVDPEQLMQKLFKLTTLEDVFSCNFNVLVDNTPKCIGVYEILDEWIKFRTDCVIKMLIYDKNEAEKRLHLLYGLEKILANIDKAIRIIKNTEKDADVVPNLMTAFKIDELQANYIADMKLRNINKEYILSRTKVISDVENEIADFNKKINSKAEIKKIIIKDLETIIKNFSIDRKSEILYSYESFNEEASEEISDYQVCTYITKQGYIKKIPKLKITPTTEIKIKEDDEIILHYEVSNKSDVLVFSSKGNVFKFKLNDIPDTMPNEIGTYINNIIDLELNETILYTIVTEDYSKNLMIVFENGKIALFPIKTYETKNNRKMLKNAFYNECKIICMNIVANEPENDPSYYLLKTSNGKQLAFAPKNLSLKASKTTMGIQIIKLNKNALVTECKKINNLSLKKINTLTANNYPAAGK